ncbi:hypothetical protein HDV05_007716 [Chytridiales sp. JEL 0842]|nr:hypothetical protein HDV05_007716 [Chytridiales sp. JEL 0842]
MPTFAELFLSDEEDNSYQSSKKGSTGGKGGKESVNNMDVDSSDVDTAQNQQDLSSENTPYGENEDDNEVTRCVCLQSAENFGVMIQMAKQNAVAKGQSIANSHSSTNGTSTPILQPPSIPDTASLAMNSKLSNPSPKKRNTMNSREAAQNYTDLLPLLNESEEGASSSGGSGANSASNTASHSPTMSSQSIRKKKSKSQKHEYDEMDEEEVRSSSQEADEIKQESDTEGVQPQNTNRKAGTKRKRGSNNGGSNGKSKRSKSSTTSNGYLNAEEGTAVAAESVSQEEECQAENYGYLQDEVDGAIAGTSQDEDDEREETETSTQPKSKKSKSSSSATQTNNSKSYNSKSKKSTSGPSGASGSQQQPPSSPPLKCRQINPRLTLNEMRKRVKQLTDYCNRFQGNQNEESTSDAGSSSSSSSKENHHDALSQPKLPPPDGSPAVKQEDVEMTDCKPEPKPDAPVDELKPKTEETSSDILDRLHKSLCLFQARYGGFRGRM